VIRRENAARQSLLACWLPEKQVLDSFRQICRRLPLIWGDPGIAVGKLGTKARETPGTRGYSLTTEFN
jgi:hypothetical protein